MRVSMYSPGKLYGFAKSDDGVHEVFFHLECFWPGDSVPDGPDPPPPVMGEEVLVEYVPDPTDDSGRQPRARRVTRTAAPTLLRGAVESFNDIKQWGFILGEDGNSFHLHRSEVQAGRLPLVGSRVSFYGGARRGRPRACYVTVL